MKTIYFWIEARSARINLWARNKKRKDTPQKEWIKGYRDWRMDVNFKYDRLKKNHSKKRQCPHN